jgi:6-phosphogluconolactonase (cycloisomerase 2 family)
MSLSPFSSLGSTPDALAITPDGNFLYVANFGSNTIAAFSICTIKSVICPAADGRLVPFLSPTVLAGIGPRAMAMNPAGNSLFVANQFSNQVAMYAIVPTFDLLTGLTFSLVKPNNPAFISTGDGPVSIAIPTGGAFLYIANSGSSSISSFNIDPAGLLLPDGDTATGGQPSSLGPK